MIKQKEKVAKSNDGLRHIDRESLVKFAEPLSVFIQQDDTLVVYYEGDELPVEA
jgi:hypothetical protein